MSPVLCTSVTFWVFCVARLNLQELATLLISLGVVNAINLDGGGSATAVDHNILINNPSDTV